MSVIVAVTDGFRVCMASDSATCRNGAIAILSQPKIVRLGPLLIGCAGSMAMLHAVRYHLAEPDLALPNETLDRWCAMAFSPWLRAYLKENDLLEKDRDRIEFPGNLLIAYKSNFVEMDGSGSIASLAYDYHAIGSGGADARGAMMVASDYEHGDAQRVACAGVKAACEFDDGCRPPITVEWTEP